MSAPDASARGRASRAKGARAERQVAALIADLTGWQIKRRVRNHAGDSDLEGVPGFSVEVKDRARPTLGDVRVWWAQAAAQSLVLNRLDAVPLLIYKRQPGEWRAVWPIGAERGDCTWRTGWDYTAEGSLKAWAEVARERVRSTLLEQNAVPCAAEIAQEAA